MLQLAGILSYPPLPAASATTTTTTAAATTAAAAAAAAKKSAPPAPPCSPLWLPPGSAPRPLTWSELTAAAPVFSEVAQLTAAEGAQLTAAAAVLSCTEPGEHYSA